MDVLELLIENHADVNRSYSWGRNARTSLLEGELSSILDDFKICFLIFSCKIWEF